MGNTGPEGQAGVRYGGLFGHGQRFDLYSTS